jgi:hypothetical protein
MTTLVRLFVTGSCEHKALHISLRSLFAGSRVEFDPVFSPEWSFTSTRVPHYLSGEKSRAARLAAALVADVEPALSERDVPDLLIAVDDVELWNTDQPAHLVAYFKATILEHLQRHPWSPSDRARAVERVRSRCSLHLLKPMLESHFFGDPAALVRAGAVKPNRFDAASTDVEAFSVTDSEYTACAVGDCAPGALDKSAHPKWYLRHLTDHAYKETRGGAAALGALAWSAVLENGTHARFARSLIADIAAKLSVDNPCTGELAPETELKPNGVLRNA